MLGRKMTPKYQQLSLENINLVVLKDKVGLIGRLVDQWTKSVYVQMLKLVYGTDAIKLSQDIGGY